MNLTSTTLTASLSTNTIRLIFVFFDSRNSKKGKMSNLDLAMFEFELGLAELDLYQHTLVWTNVRWRGQEREG